ncbi:MAG: hypothetical protein GY803_31505 [Chloroflexi bacterium]|nr:hypothetical protein [Chloroflexota bacterium]
MIERRLNGSDSRFTFYVLRFLPVAVLPAIILLFFNKMTFSNLILARGDTFLYFYPYWEAAANALANGRAPLWNPHLFMGAPFLANSQVGFFYPLNWSVWLTLPAPYAVSASILLHLIIAGWGAYLAARRALSLSREAAGLTAVLFALGGYLTAQVEHINQLQGLAWLPWFFAALSRLETTRPETRDWRLILRRGTAVAILFSLQLLAGHTQTAFITGVGIAIFVYTDRRNTDKLSEATKTVFLPIRVYKIYILRFMPLLIGVLLAFLITAVQLLPTLELTQYSSRQGGLAVNEVLSFSLHPLLMGRSLLPSYGQSLFTEYVAFLPLTALVLAVVGGWQWRERPAVRPFVVITAVALLLALGRFTPLYWLLARLPGFDLFRVPARWLALYAMGMALLAGAGWDAVKSDWGVEIRDWRLKRPLRWAILLILFLIGWNFLSVPLAQFIPLGPETPAAYPNWQTLLGWLLELAFFVILIRSPFHPFTLSPLLLLSLFLASRALPYNNLTTPEAYFDLRPPISRLQTDTAAPPGRLLSLSNIFFDPGDQAEIDTIYADQLPEQARYDYTVAIKQKEIVAPNLPMTYGLASVDGFDGGILPLASYSELASFVLPDQTRTIDGRLREYLTAVPDPRWLDLFNAQYLITDKTGDVWRSISPEQDVFFDLQHPITLAPGESAAVGYVPAFPAAGLALIADGKPGGVQVVVENVVWELTPQAIGDGLWRVAWPSATTAQAITLTASLSDQWSIQGLTLINEKDQTFHSLVPGQYRLLHSGDVKIYENLDVLPRAFLMQNWQWQPNTAASVAAMSDPGFDPRQVVVLTGEGENQTAEAAIGKAKARIVEYAPEQVVIRVDAEFPAALVLTDGHYPGWRATLNGQSLPIYQADAFFRAIIVPVGQHEVVLSFVSSSFENGRLLSLLGLTLLVIGVSGSHIRTKRHQI